MPTTRSPTTWPEGGDPEGARLLARRLDEAASPVARRALRRPDLAAAIGCLGGHSPYLSDLAVRETDTLVLFARSGPAVCVADALARLDGIQPGAPREAVAASLRAAKRRVALATALADIGGVWTLEEVTAALSRLAERSLALGVGHLLDAAARAGRLRRPDGLAVIGLGKLGAGELNYSSDVDLLLLFEPQAERDPDAASATFSRLARDLVTLMQARDADGYAFRIDLRLRPDPSLTPPALSLDAALAYYEGQGATWERAALSKARVVAGDAGLGRRFLAGVAPFIWRRHLDFAAIADMRAMKARIDRQQAALGARPLAAGGSLLGHDLKLGEGGIREIEFAAQTLQLVWGGREPALRIPATMAALAGLAAAGKLPADEAGALSDAYRALRQAEHRLQMVADRQTHALPADAAGLDAFARFLGARDGAALTGRLLALMLPVRRVFDALFADGGEREDGWGRAQRALPSLGFERTEVAASLLKGWQEGVPRALRHERARALVGAIAPALLASIARQREPDAALSRLARLLDRLQAGVQIFSLLARNPGLIEQLADLLGASPVLADHLASVPGAIEGLLVAETVDPDPRRTLRRELSGARDHAAVEVAIEVTRRFVRGEQFRLGVAELQGRLGVDRTGAARSALAAAAVAALLPRVLRAHRCRFGRIAGGGLAVVALGKAGSLEMMSDSDLDLMLVYDAPEDAQSRGRGIRALAASAYYGRLSHALVAAITARGRDGALFDVDMRLRPSGRQGPVAVSMSSFVRYHREEAWTWERMALTRARVIAGPVALKAELRGAIETALDGSGTAETVRADALAMRRRLLRDKPAEGPWDVRMRAGGLTDVEFIAQALQLGSGLERRWRRQKTSRALAALARAGLLGRADARGLIEADHSWRTVQSGLRLLIGPAPAEPTERMRETVAALLGIPPGALAAHMDKTASFVRDCFGRTIGWSEEARHDAGSG